MLHNRFTLSRAGLALALIAALGVGACDDPVGEDHDHAEPTTVVILLGGQEIASATVTSATGEIHVAPGTETAHLTVEYRDEDGNEVHVDDGDFYLEVDIADESIADFEQDTPGEFGGHVHGLAEGETTATFKLMHGTVGSGHADFVPAGITVHVAP